MSTGEIEFQKIGLCITDRCNAKCDMCCFSCGPNNKQCLSQQDIEIIVHQAAKIPSIKSIGISGGEAMLYPELVHFALKLIKEHGMKPSLASNGFWAKTYPLAYNNWTYVNTLDTKS